MNSENSNFITLPGEKCRDRNRVRQTNQGVHGDNPVVNFPGSYDSRSSRNSQEAVIHSSLSNLEVVHNGHPVFPIVSEYRASKMLDEAEHLQRELNNRLDFYHQRVKAQVDRFVVRSPPFGFFAMDGAMEPNNLIKEVIRKVATTPLVPERLSWPIENDTSLVVQSNFPPVPQLHRKNSTFSKQSGDTLATKSALSDNEVEVWSSRPPCCLVIGQIGSGKTTMAKWLCRKWNCQYVNATELILAGMGQKTQKGLQIHKMLVNGQDLNDRFVIQLLREKLQSEECSYTGYILDDFPTYSEAFLTIPEQMEFLLSLRTKPECIIEMKISEALLYQRRLSVRIDPYTGNTFSATNTVGSLFPCSPTKEYGNALFDCAAEEEMVPTYLTRWEDIPENVENEFSFYRKAYAPKILRFILNYAPKQLIVLDGQRQPIDNYDIVREWLQSNDLLVAK